MRWKCIIVGAVVFFVVSFILSMVTGPLIHEGALKETYAAHSEFWRPELNQDPPDMAALMPMWIGFGLLVSFVVAWLYCSCKCGEGPGWKRGLRFGLGLGIFACVVVLTYSGVFNLPFKIWYYWMAETIFVYVVCGAAMGWAVAKWGGD